MVEIDVRPTPDGWTCGVAVDAAGEQTRHTVLVSRADAERWAAAADDDGVEDLVRRSFEFLLERERPSSILGRFELAVIERYFPEYGAVIVRSR